MNYHFQANNTNGLWQTATSNPEDYTVILLIELHQGKLALTAQNRQPYSQLKLGIVGWLHFNTIEDLLDWLP